MLWRPLKNFKKRELQSQFWGNLCEMTSQIKYQHAGAGKGKPLPEAFEDELEKNFLRKDVAWWGDFCKRNEMQVEWKPAAGEAAAKTVAK